VVECDRKIARALKRLEDDEGAGAGLGQRYALHRCECLVYHPPTARL